MMDLITLQKIALIATTLGIIISFIITFWSLWYNYKQAKVYEQNKEIIRILSSIKHSVDEFVKLTEAGL